MRRWLIGVLLLVGLLVIADRAALAAAKSQLAAQVQREENLAERPAVDLRGVPFLTQAVRGRYDGGRLELRDLRTEKLRVNTLVIDLREVALPLSDLVSGNIGAVPVGSVSGVALVTYVDLAAATGVPGLRITPKGDRLELTFPVEQFGAGAPVTASARIGVAEQAVRMTAVQVQGVQLPESVTTAVLDRLQASLGFGVLPYDLRVTDVRVADAGVEVSANARDTVLRKP